MLGHRVDGLEGAGPGFERTDADAAGGVQIGEGGDEVRKAFALRGEKREIASRDDNLAVAGVDEAPGAVQKRVERFGLRSAAEFRDDAEGALSGAAVLHLQVGARGAHGYGRGLGRRDLGPSKDGDRGLEASADLDRNHGVMALEVVDELLAVVLRACGHGAAADDEQVGVRVLFGKLPSARQVVGLHLKRLCLVETAAECLETHFHAA